MSRPVNADAAATRQRILDTALHLFADRGVDGVSIRELAANARVSSAMIHHCFGGKEGLHQAAIETMYTELRDLREQLFVLLANQGARSLGDIFEDAVRVTFRFCRRHRSSVRLLMRDVMAHGELDEVRREKDQALFLEKAPMLLAALLGRNPIELRMPLQSAVSLVARYAVSSDRDLIFFSGESNLDTALEKVEEHLVISVRSLLALPAN